MKNPLHQMEDFIEGILERSTGVFPHRTPTFNRISADLLQTLDEHAQPDPTGNYWIAPNRYVISLNRRSLEILQADSNLTKQLETKLEEHIRQREMFLAGPITLAFRSDAKISARALQIQAEIAGDANITMAHPHEPVGEIIGEIPANAFLILHGDQHLALEKSVIRIGRHAENQIMLDDALASRRHAILRARKGQFLLTDLSSKHGTRVNNIPISESILTSGDVIRIGNTEMIYGDECQSERTQPLAFDAPLAEFLAMPARKPS
jgi:hypothetical protein